MLFADAAEAVLCEAGRRLSFREIAETAIDRGYITSSARDPSASMAWAVKNDIKKRERSGDTQRFVRIGSAATIASPVVPSRRRSDS